MLLYNRIGSQLESMILDGKLKAGDRLPTTRELARDFGVTVQTTQQAVSLLNRRGYRRISVISHLPDEGSPVAALAISVAERAYARHGLPMQTVFVPGWAASHRQGIERAREALDGSMGGKPDAFLVLNDQTCMGVIFELLCRGLRIPQDIAVLATSNRNIDIPCPCPLTRLERDPADLARLLVEDVVARVEGREADLAPRKSMLIVGGSCGE